MSRKILPPSKQQPAASPRRLLLWAGVISITLAATAAIFWFAQSQQAFRYVPEVTGAPSAAIDQTVFDYGDVKLGTTIKTVFRVKNVGDAQLAFRSAPRVEVLEGC